MLPVVARAGIVVDDREVRIARLAVVEYERRLVLVAVDALGEQLVGDDDLRLRPDEITAFRAMDEAVLEESLGPIDLERNRVGRREEVGQSLGDLGVSLARVPA